jgi:hypothetical protein
MEGAVSGALVCYGCIHIPFKKIKVSQGDTKIFPTDMTDVPWFM